MAQPHENAKALIVKIDAFVSAVKESKSAGLGSVEVGEFLAEAAELKTALQGV
jgi:hypothetical protein